MKTFDAVVRIFCAVAIVVIFTSLRSPARNSGNWFEMRLPYVGDVWDLKATAFAEPGLGWAVGSVEETGCALVLKYEGGRWKEEYKPCEGKLTVLHLVDVDLSAALEGWIVGDRYWIWSDPDRFKGIAVRISGGKCRRAKVQNAGRSFKLEAVSIPPGSDTAFAVGGVAQKKRRKGLVMRYSGGMWRVVNVPLSLSSEWELKDIDCPAPGKCWAVGRTIHRRWAEPGQRPKKRPKNINPLLVLSYNNGEWKREQVPPAPWGVIDPDLAAVSFPSVDEGWVAGKGVVFHYVGGKWFPDAPASKSEGWNIKGLSFPDKRHGYAVGWNIDEKKPLWLERTQTGWTRLKTRYDDKLTALNDVFFLRPGTGWAVGGKQDRSDYPAGAFIYRSQ